MSAPDDARLSAGLRRLDALPADAATAAFLKVCGARRWAEGMTAARPFGTVAALEAAAERLWWALGPADFLEAFAAHPRIGEKKGGAWSAQEQAGAATAEQRTLARLAAQNDAYFERHGFIFIVCATGKSAGEMLALLEARLPRPTPEEVRTAAGEQAKITRLRLHKWLGEAGT